MQHALKVSFVSLKRPTLTVASKIKTLKRPLYVLSTGGLRRRRFAVDRSCASLLCACLHRLLLTRIFSEASLSLSMFRTRAYASYVLQCVVSTRLRASRYGVCGGALGLLCSWSFQGGPLPPICSWGAPAPSSPSPPPTFPQRIPPQPPPSPESMLSPLDVCKYLVKRALSHVTLGRPGMLGLSSL